MREGNDECPAPPTAEEKAGNGNETSDAPNEKQARLFIGDLSKQWRERVHGVGSGLT